MQQPRFGTHRRFALSLNADVLFHVCLFFLPDFISITVPLAACVSVVSYTQKHTACFSPAGSAIVFLKTIMGVINHPAEVLQLDDSVHAE